jgi:uncharacterized protein (DUF1778 family)
MERWEVPPQRQVNVRLDDETIEVLEAAGFLDGRNLTDEVRAAIRNRAAEAGQDPIVREALELKRKRNRPAEPQAPPVSSLEDKRRRRK